MDCCLWISLAMSTGFVSMLLCSSVMQSSGGVSWFLKTFLLIFFGFFSYNCLYLDMVFFMYSFLFFFFVFFLFFFWFFFFLFLVFWVVFFFFFFWFCSWWGGGVE